MNGTIFLVVLLGVYVPVFLWFGLSLMRDPDRWVKDFELHLFGLTITPLSRKQARLCGFVAIVLMTCFVGFVAVMGIVALIDMLKSRHLMWMLAALW